MAQPGASESTQELNNQMLRTLSQQFERINLVIGDIRERMERQEIEIAQIRRGQSTPRGRGSGNGDEGDENSIAGEERVIGRRRPIRNEGRGVGAVGARRVGRRERYEESDDESEEEEDVGVRDERRGGNQHRDRRDEHVGSIKMSIPSFHGKNDPEAYLEWEKRVERVFNCHSYSEGKKVNLAVVEFKDYANTWWDKLEASRRRNRERPVRSWEEMKTLMRKRFVPAWYHRELYQKLQGLVQGNKSVGDYDQELETLVARLGLEEDEEATMARFLKGLNLDIADEVERSHYVDYDELYQLAVKVERQMQRRKSDRSKLRESSSKWKTGWERKEVKAENKNKTEGATSKPKDDPKGKGKLDSSKEKLRNVKCYRCLGFGHYAYDCPNKRAMTMKPTGEVQSEHEEEEQPEEDMSLVGSSEDEEPPVEGELLVTRRVLSMQLKDQEEQRENIFHTRCFVSGKVCSLIIDGGSCTNVASTELVSKLGLKTSKHPVPYSLQWLNNSGEVKVNQQVLVTFAVGRYEDQVMCDVVPMEAAHVLLGRPWQFDRRAIHDGFTNKYSFTHKGRKITLALLCPKQLVEDHKNKTLREKEEEKNEKEQKERKEKSEKEEENEKKIKKGKKTSFANRKWWKKH